MTTPQPTNNVDGGYTPTFSARFRKVIYVLGVIASALAILLGVLSTDLNFPKWASDTISIIGPILPGIAAAFGVHYAGISI
jgi:hypothetical protein